MKSKNAFYYGSFFVGLSLLFLWVLGGQALRIKNLSFNRDSGLDATASGQNSGKNTINKTDVVVRGVLSAFKELSELDETKDPAEIETLLKEKLNAAISEQIEPVAIPSVTAANLRIVPNSTTNQQIYLNGVANLMRSVYHNTLSQELRIFDSTISDTTTIEQKKWGQKELIKARDAYKKLAEGLSQLSIPAREANKTVVLINSYYALSAGSDLFAQSLSDPVLSLQGLQVYARGYLALKNLNQ